MYFCTACGHETDKKVMSCPNCKEFGTMEKSTNSISNKIKVDVKNLPEAYKSNKKNNRKLIRYEFKQNTLNNFFGGGGLVKGSLNFLSAEPGTGKSTFLGQISKLLRDSNLKILYYSGEEDVYQIGDRLNRLYEGEENLLENINVYYGDNLEELFGLIERDKPDIIILDSIQTIYSKEKDSPKGSRSQQSYCLEKIRTIYKAKGYTGFIIGHVTKDGDIAGDKTLEHIVDGVYLLEGQNGRTDSIRILKTLKSRFGGTDNVVVMKMKRNGFEIVEEENAFKIFIEESGKMPGSAFAPILEGNQLFLLEVQSLLQDTAFSMPQRVGDGINKHKLDTLIAVLSDKAKFQFVTKDIFIKVIAPFNFKNAIFDLAVIMAIVSKLLNKKVNDYIFIGQVGLQGEIRSVPNQEEIINKLIGIGYKKENIISRDKYKDIKTLIEELFLGKGKEEKGKEKEK